MNKFYEHEDYDDYYEFGPDGPELPEEFQRCLFCKHYVTAGQPRLFVDYEEMEHACRPCLAVPGKLVEDDTPAGNCKHFAVVRAAEDAAREAAMDRHA